MRYRRLQLKRMAKHLLSIKDDVNGKYFEFVIMLSLRTGKDIVYIQNKIKHYARGNIS